MSAIISRLVTYARPGDVSCVLAYPPSLCRPRSSTPALRALRAPCREGRANSRRVPRGSRRVSARSTRGRPDVRDVGGGVS
jgi:hypothetical protein